MPPPSRAQFDAASKKVLESAPAGLSREDFFALIDRELSPAPLRPTIPEVTGRDSRSGGVVYDNPEDAQKAKLTSGEIPSTFAGGFLKSLKDQILTPKFRDMMESSAHPKTEGDFLGLLMAQGAARGTRLTDEVAKAGGAASAANRGKGLLSRVRGYWQGVGEDINAPTQTLGSGPHEIPGRPFSTTGSSVGSRPVKVGAYGSGPSAKPPAPVTAPAASANTLEAELKGVARPADSRISGLPPESPVAPGVKAGSAPKATSMDNLAERMGMGKDNPNPETVGPGPIREHDPLAAELMGGPRPPRITSLKADKIPSELWPELRRYYGSEKLAQLTGKTVEEIKQLAPGPSRRLPMEIEDSLNQNPEGIFKYLPELPKER